MANLITLFKSYAPLLDEVYKNASKTAVLESDDTLASQGANANEIVIPKMEMDGLGDYDRNSGYVTGDVVLTHETVKFNYERGRMFSVDNMDDRETAGVAFGKLAGEFIRTKVVPEIDAVRFAQYASAPGISTRVEGEFTEGTELLSALVEACSKMDEDEVPDEDRYLFITPGLYNKAIAVDTTKSTEILSSFTEVIKVPQTRFYTSVELNDGKSVGETAGGYVKGIGAKDINFMIIHKGALLQFTKHQMPKVILPEANPTADAYKFGYRIYGLNDVFANRTAGIYFSAKA